MAMKNKPTRSRVRQPMTNASTRSRKRKTTSTFVVPPAFPWFNAAHLAVKRGGQQLALRAALRDAGKVKPSLSMQVHGDDCPWSVVLWPRASDCASAEVDEEMRGAIERRDANCKCIPLIMYTGARA